MAIVVVIAVNSIAAIAGLIKINFYLLFFMSYGLLYFSLFNLPKMTLNFIFLLYDGGASEFNENYNDYGGFGWIAWVLVAVVIYYETLNKEDKKSFLTNCGILNFLNLFSTNGEIGRGEYIITCILFSLFLYLNYSDLYYKSLSDNFRLWHLPFIWILIAQGAKRCHDICLSGISQFNPLYLSLMFFKKGTNIY